MLVLTRKLEQSINIGSEIKVMVLDIKGNAVELGIDAPLDVRVYRSEIYDRIKHENVVAAIKACSKDVSLASRELGRRKTKTSYQKPRAVVVEKIIKKGET